MAFSPTAQDPTLQREAQIPPAPEQARNSQPGDKEISQEMTHALRNLYYGIARFNQDLKDIDKSRKNLFTLVDRSQTWSTIADRVNMGWVHADLEEEIAGLVTQIDDLSRDIRPRLAEFYYSAKELF